MEKERFKKIMDKVINSLPIADDTPIPSVWALVGYLRIFGEDLFSKEYDEETLDLMIRISVKGYLKYFFDGDGWEIEEKMKEPLGSYIYKKV